MFLPACGCSFTAAGRTALLAPGRAGVGLPRGSATTISPLRLAAPSLAPSARRGAPARRGLEKRKMSVVDGEERTWSRRAANEAARRDFGKKTWFDVERETLIHLQNLESERRREHEELLARLAREYLASKDPLGPLGDGTLVDTFLDPKPVSLAASNEVGSGGVFDTFVAPHHIIVGSDQLVPGEGESWSRAKHRTDGPQRARTRRGIGEAMKRHSYDTRFSDMEFNIRLLLMQMDLQRDDDHKKLVKRVQQEALSTKDPMGPHGCGTLEDIPHTPLPVGQPEAEGEFVGRPT
mmetsp:Transcript_2106/g.4912  ORF Transcript_2106/g.4912 Transcript_2106/m.4912 type:complete len:294 (+) Transcript_2106:46-927(+)